MQKATQGIKANTNQTCITRGKTDNRGSPCQQAASQRGGRQQAKRQPARGETPGSQAAAPAGGEAVSKARGSQQPRRQPITQEAASSPGNAAQRGSKTEAEGPARRHRARREKRHQFLGLELQLDPCGKLCFCTHDTLCTTPKNIYHAE